MQLRNQFCASNMSSAEEFNLLSCQCCQQSGRNRLFLCAALFDQFAANERGRDDTHRLPKPQCAERGAEHRDLPHDANSLRRHFENLAEMLDHGLVAEEPVDNLARLSTLVCAVK